MSRRLPQGESPLLHHRPTAPPEAIPEAEWTPIPYWMEGAADVAETDYTPRDVRRRNRAAHRTQGQAHARLPTGAVHQLRAFITDRDGVPWTSRPTIAATPRSRTPSETSSTAWGSGRFPANAAWLAAGDGRTLDNASAWASNFRRRFFLAGRLARPAVSPCTCPRTPWRNQFGRALARLRALPLPS